MEEKMAVIREGVVGPGVDSFLDMVLTGGVTHRVYVTALNGNPADLDLEIYDQNDHLVAIDNSTDSDAYCFVTPLWTGPFRLLVKTADLASSFRILVDA
jgi:hypothetical protein